MNITPEALDILTLPSVLLEERSQLPPIPCIYFAIDSSGAVQYIGRSVNVRQRWLNHHRAEQLTGISGIRIAYLTIDSIDLLAEVESALIEWFNPPLNGSLLPRIEGTRPTGSVERRTGDHPLLIRWRLSEVMARHRVKAKDLAEQIGVSANALSNLRNSEKMPLIDGDRLAELCVGITKLSAWGESVTPYDLIEYKWVKEQAS